VEASEATDIERERSVGEILSAALNRARSAARDNSRLQSGPMKQRDSLPVTCMKSLLLVTVFQQLKPPIGEHAIAVHQ